VPGERPLGEEEAHQALVVATAYVAARYVLLDEADRPDVNRAQWSQHEERIDAAILAGDADDVRVSVAEWVEFAFSEMPLPEGRNAA
jgi:hypothetical protein